MTTDIQYLAGEGKVEIALEQKTPLLPDEEIRPFVEYFFAAGQKHLQSVKEHSLPLYVLDREALRARANRFKNVFQDVLPDVGFYYAVKSNNHPEIARTILDCGLGLDVSSGVELAMALRLNAEEIIFSGPGKTDAELQQAVCQANRVTILIDSFGELERLDKIAGAYATAVRVGVRLTTNPNGLWRKFGILPNELPSFWNKIKDSRYLNFTGLQFHTSWNLSPEAQVTFIKELGMVLQQLPVKALQKIHFIDIGGGYWPPRGEWLQEAGTTVGRLRKDLGIGQRGEQQHYRLPSLPIETFAEQISRAIAKYIHPFVACRICLEPGRWLCNDAMHLLLTVVDKKSDDLVITDAGTNAVGWERFETDYFPVLNLSRPAMEEKPCNILGSLCTPHDVWGYNYWGEDIQVGDVLMIPTQGAYTYSLRQNFIKDVPDVVVVDSV